VESARSGDRDALGEILGRGYPKLVAFYVGMGLSPAEAEDLASEACEGVLRNLSRLRRIEAFERWFWTVARNRLRSRLRARYREPRAPYDPPADDPLAEVISGDEHRAIVAALAELSPRDREILWLREVEELSYEDIAGRLRIGVGAVRVAALRARRRLEEAYERLAGS
jgi:RNA polymerase sigma-70 factor (ECF subfamily)